MGVLRAQTCSTYLQPDFLIKVTSVASNKSTGQFRGASQGPCVDLNRSGDRGATVWMKRLSDNPSNAARVTYLELQDASQLYLRTLFNLFLFSLLRGVPREGPDCCCPSEAGVLCLIRGAIFIVIVIMTFKYRWGM